MTIRHATEADAARLVAMAESFLAQTRYGHLLKANPSTLAVLLTQVLELGVVIVADVDGPLEGMLAIVALTNPITGERYADELVWWVEPQARSKLVGPRLLRAAERWATAQGLPMIKMVAPAGSSVGQFYERCGYVAVETAYCKILPREAD